ncbi:MAG: hypothetical protein AAB036_11970 [Elusimicrobiota bacterium]
MVIRPFVVAASLLLAAAPAAARLQAVGAARGAVAPAPLPAVLAPLSAPFSAPLAAPYAAALVSGSPSPRVLTAPSRAPAARASFLAPAAVRIPAFASASRAGNAPAEPITAPQLDALFDGPLPLSREVLSRAEALRVEPSELALALVNSLTPAEAASRLSRLGVLSPREEALAQSDKDGLEFLLARLWRKTADSIPAPFSVDRRFPIPALTVRRENTTYFVHGVNHGQVYPPRRHDVLSTVERIAESGEVLYSEENLPAHYGYRVGREALDHASSAGAPAAIVPAARTYTAFTLALKRAFDLLALPFIALIPWARWKTRQRAAALRAEGLDDNADHLDDMARYFYVSKPDPDALRLLELPQPLGATQHPLSVRSRAIAAAVAADAAALGASVVHLIVGAAHIHEIAWSLAHSRKSHAPLGQMHVDLKT